MAKKHDFPARLIWTGNTGTGTSGYKNYERTWDMALPGKAVVHCSNDPIAGRRPDEIQSGRFADYRAFRVPHALVSAPLLSQQNHCSQL